MYNKLKIIMNNVPITNSIYVNNHNLKSFDFSLNPLFYYASRLRSHDD